jgi:hypothetical protein
MGDMRLQRRDPRQEKIRRDKKSGEKKVRLLITGPPYQR